MSKWLKQYDIRRMLEENNGIIIIPNFLPAHVADALLENINDLPTEAYESALSDQGDPVSHSFNIADVDESEILGDLSRLLWKMLGEQTLPNFSVGRYSHHDHISPHDDGVLELYSKEEYTEIMEFHYPENHTFPLPERYDTEDTLLFSRQAAMVYYLNKDWKDSYNGAFLDLANEEEKAVLPAFNTFVSFVVPRMHCVTPVTAPPGRQRLSIFGWWLVEGQQYSDGEESDPDDEEEEQEGKKKLKTNTESPENAEDTNARTRNRKQGRSKGKKKKY